MRLLDAVLTTIITALLVAMIALVSLQVLNRYGPGLSIPWTEEATRTAYVAMIFVGSTLAVVRCNHVSVNSLVLKMPSRAQRIVGSIGALLSAIFFGFVAYGNYIYTVVNWDAAFPTMPFLSIGHVIAVVFASSVLTAALFVWRAFWPCPPTDSEVDGV